MMKIVNARITKVNVGFDDCDRLSVWMTFESHNGCYDCGFVLENLVDIQRLKTLMNYTAVYLVKNLKGKIIRLVLDSERFLRGFGHLIEDKFVPTYTNEFTELYEVEFGAMMEK